MKYEYEHFVSTHSRVEAEAASIVAELQSQLEVIREERSRLRSQLGSAD